MLLKLLGNLPYRFCRPIMTKPKPAKPATPETPATPPPQGTEQQQHGGDANADPSDTAGNADAEAAPASGEPMETEKPDHTSSTTA